MSDGRRLGPSFFARDATEVAPELLHKLLRVDAPGGLVDVRICEVEAYTQDDPASHSWRGPTPRNAAMFGPPGRLYVYFVYGMHHCLNLVTGPDGDGQAVLIRSVRIEGVDPRLTNGPGRLTKVIGIDLADNATHAELFDDGVAPPPDAVTTPRIGITKAVEWPRRWLLPPAR